MIRTSLQFTTRDGRSQQSIGAEPLSRPTGVRSPSGGAEGERIDPDRIEEIAEGLAHGAIVVYQHDQRVFRVVEHFLPAPAVRWAGSYSSGAAYASRVLTDVLGTEAGRLAQHTLLAGIDDLSLRIDVSSRGVVPAASMINVSARGTTTRTAAICAHRNSGVGDAGTLGIHHSERRLG